MIVNDIACMKPSETGCYPDLDALWSTFPRSTRLHMENVGKYANGIYWYLVRNQMEDINEVLGGEFRAVSGRIFTLHDIGRHYIPFSLLNKVGKLTEEEQQTLKDHTVNARRAIKSIYEPPFSEKMMRVWEDVAVYHHERYDGTGYPEGLAGREIPLAARICAVADTYEGIISWKPYKKKQTTSREAVEIIVSESGKQFQPEIVEAFRNQVMLSLPS